MWYISYIPQCDTFDLNHKCGISYIPQCGTFDLNHKCGIYTTLVVEIKSAALWYITDIPRFVATLTIYGVTYMVRSLITSA